MEAINKRRSIRKYLDKKVPKEDILKILRASMQAPSAINQKPWEFLVIENKDILNKISENFKNIRFCNEASFIIVYMFNKDKVQSINYFTQDLASSVTCGLLEAYELKIGSCWCGIYPNNDRVVELNKIINNKTENLVPFCVCTFGYPVSQSEFKFVDRFDESNIHFEEI